MIIPEWTTFNIIFYSFCAILVLAIGPAEYYGMSMMSYSKFRKKEGIPAMYGMVIGYFMPIVVITLFAWSYLPKASFLQWALYLAMVIHFAKRVLECFFLHQFSGPIDIFTTLMIASLYSFAAGLLGWTNSTSFPAPDIWSVLGILIFMAGITGNFIHHKLLADLRKNSLDYFIPKGGLFEYVACPHYLFEILCWLGFALISRHFAAWLILLFVTCYLTARALRGLRWYQEKFKDFPKDRKAILPFVL